MNKRRKVLSAVAAATLGLAGLIGAAAPAAHASTTITVTDGGVSPSSVSATTVAIDNQSSGSIRILSSGLSYLGNSCATVGPCQVSFSAAPLTFDVEPSASSALVTITTIAPATIGTFTVTYGSGGSDPSSSSAAPPQTFELSITPTDGTTCTNTSESGTQGTWIDLPAASDCTPPASMPGATLLGWATNPNFPVEIAKRQVDNGWGAYETFNDEGQLTGVFIPAGKPTFLSAAGKIYPIWDL